MKVKEFIKSFVARNASIALYNKVGKYWKRVWNGEEWKVTMSGDDPYLEAHPDTILCPDKYREAEVIEVASFVPTKAYDDYINIVIDHRTEISMEMFNEMCEALYGIVEEALPKNSTPLLIENVENDIHTLMSDLFTTKQEAQFDIYESSDE